MIMNAHVDRVMVMNAHPHSYPHKGKPRFVGELAEVLGQGSVKMKPLQYGAGCITDITASNIHLIHV